MMMILNRYLSLIIGNRTKLPTVISGKSKYRILFPCTEQAISAANVMAFEAFGKRDYISENVIRKWVKKNPNILSVLVDSKFEPRGYFDLIPLTETTFNQLRQGNISDKAITDADILSPDENINYLYIGGITTNDRNPVIGSLLLSSLLLKLKYIYPKGRYYLGAVAGTEDGRHYMEIFGFEQSIYPKGRNFYAREIHSYEIDHLLLEIGIRSHALDYSAYRWNCVHDKPETLSKIINN